MREENVYRVAVHQRIRSLEMKRLKQAILWSLYHLKLWSVGLWLENVLCVRKPHVMVLLYHHLSDGRNDQALSEVEKGLPIEAFETQLREISRWYRPMNAEKLVKVSRQPELLTEDAFVVTFDDGYLDNRHLAGPILQKYDCTGLVFLATDYIDTDKRFWWVRLNDLLRETPAEKTSTLRQYVVESIGINGEAASLDLESWHGRRELRRMIAGCMESMPVAQQTSFLDGLEAMTASATETCLPLVSWQDAAAMQGEGFEFGAHTQSHPRMTRLSPDQNREEVTVSARMISERLGRGPSTFAYPFGDVDDAVAGTVRECGIDLAFTVQPGVFVPGKTDAMLIPRLQPNCRQPYEILPVLFLLKMNRYFPRMSQSLLRRVFGF